MSDSSTSQTPESAIRKVRKEADRAESEADTNTGKLDPGVEEWFRGWANGARYAAEKFSKALGGDQ